MSKGTFFTGQPIFSQLLNLLPKPAIHSISRELGADRYCKRFKTYDHVVTMLYGVFNHCQSLREVTTGLLAWERRIHHLGLDFHPRRSTLSDANERRSHEVFEKIYFKLLDRYRHLLPDSRRKSRKDNLYILDSTSISLFQEILKGPGIRSADGKRKGGIKVHTLLKAHQDVPTMIRFSPAANNDVTYLKEVALPKGSVIVFDKGYRSFPTYNRLTKQGITWVTRRSANFVYKKVRDNVVTDYHQSKGIRSDQNIILGYDYSNKNVKVEARLITYYDSISKRNFEFLTNNSELSPLTIANYYRQRWQIETFFKRIKQNYPLQYFLGDNENAIKIQIWCALIADLLLKVIRSGSRSSMAFSNIVSLIRLHLMTYMDLKKFLESPEKSLLAKIKQQRLNPNQPDLFAT